MGKLYRVIPNLYHTKVPDNLEFGYETKELFRDALRRLLDRFACRTGECIGDRHGFLRLRFHDTPGGRPDEAWMPMCLIRDTGEVMPEPDEPDEQDELIREIDEAMGFE